MPKLVFLAKKANKERKVVKALEGEAAEIAKEQRRKENAALEEAANELGGTVMPASESERGPPPGAIKLGGVGETWAKEVRFVVEDVVEAVSSLAESFLDPRTRAAVCAAERARNRSSGGSAANTETADEDDGSPATVGEARQKSLAAMNAVWAACERAASRLPRDNRAAVRRRWKERAAVMDDGLEEMLEVSKGADAEGVEGALQNALEGLSVQDERAAAGADEQGDGEDDDEEDDEMDMFGNEVDLSPTERARVAKIVPLVRIGKMLHHRVLTACIGSAVSSSSSSSSAPTSSSAAQLANSGSPSAELDMDELETEATTLSEAQDDLVASVVYGTHDLAVVREATEEYVSVALRLARIAGASAAVLESLESARDVDAGAGGRAERKALKGKVSKSEKDKAESDKTGKAYFELCAQQLVRLERALEE